MVSTSAGLAFAAVNFLAMVEVAQYMLGDSAWIAILTAGVLCLMAAAVFSELTGMRPSAAGIRLWTRLGISDRFSLGFTLLYLVTVLAVIAADSFVLAAAIHAGIPAIPGVVWILMFLTLVLLVNLRGVRPAGLLEDATTFALLASLVLVTAVALARGGFRLTTPLAVGPPGNFLQAVALGVFIYVGFEWVTPLAEEVTDQRSLPRGMFLALGVIGVAFAGFSLAMTHFVPQRVLARTLIPQLLVGRTALGAVGFWWMLAVTAVTAITTFNGSFVSASRLLYALARERSLPRSLGRLNLHFVPHRALWILWMVSVSMALVVFWSGAYRLLINAGATLEALMYVVAAWAVIGLRRRESGAARPFRFGRGTLGPWATIVVFLGLAAGAATSSTGLPLPSVPWTAVLLAVLALGAVAYVRLGPPAHPPPTQRRPPPA